MMEWKEIKKTTIRSWAREKKKKYKLRNSKKRSFRELLE